METSVAVEAVQETPTCLPDTVPVTLVDAAGAVVSIEFVLDEVPLVVLSTPASLTVVTL